MFCSLKFFSNNFDGHEKIAQGCKEGEFFGSLVAFHKALMLTLVAMTLRKNQTNLSRITSYLDTSYFFCFAVNCEYRKTKFCGYQPTYHENFVTDGSSYRFHSPFEFPLHKTNEFISESRKSTWISVTPQISYLGESLIEESIERFDKFLESLGMFFRCSFLNSFEDDNATMQTRKNWISSKFTPRTTAFKNAREAKFWRPADVCNFTCQVIFDWSQ